MKKYHVRHANGTSADMCETRSQAMKLAHSEGLQVFEITESGHAYQLNTTQRKANGKDQRSTSETPKNRAKARRKNGLPFQIGRSEKETLQASDVSHDFSFG